jgi:hypothetical protein
MAQQTAAADGGERRRRFVERVIDGVATGAGNSISWMAEHGVLFAIFLVLWVAFAIALVLSQGTIDEAWQWIRDLNWVLQVVLWVLFLPVMAGMWVWETSWPLAVRLVLVIGLAGFNLIVFLPRAVARG